MPGAVEPAYFSGGMLGPPGAKRRHMVTYGDTLTAQKPNHFKGFFGFKSPLSHSSPQSVDGTVDARYWDSLMRRRTTRRSLSKREIRAAVRAIARTPAEANAAATELRSLENHAGGIVRLRSDRILRDLETQLQHRRRLEASRKTDKQPS